MPRPERGHSPKRWWNSSHRRAMGAFLDVATGTGLVAVEAARLVGPGGAVLATSASSPDWEAHVAATSAEAGVINVGFAAMPAEALAFPDVAFDVVYCQFGLMFVPDPVGALREMRRVLRPDGRLGVAVWSVPDEVGIFLIARIVTPALPPPEGEPPLSPLGMGAPGLIEGLVEEAGFSRDVDIDAVTRHYEIADAEREWQRLVRGADLANQSRGGSVPGERTAATAR